MNSDHETTKGAEAQKKHIWDNPKNVQLLLWVFSLGCAVLLLIDAFIHRHLSFEHDELGYEGWFGFYPLYGFVACVVLVLVAKQMRKVVMRDEDYYE